MAKLQVFPEKRATGKRTGLCAADWIIRWSLTVLLGQQIIQRIFRHRQKFWSP